MNTRFGNSRNILAKASEAKLMGNFIRYDEARGVSLYEYNNMGWLFSIPSNILITVYQLNINNHHKHNHRKCLVLKSNNISNKKSYNYKKVRNKYATDAK
jgi:hypothetical protein